MCPLDSFMRLEGHACRLLPWHPEAAIKREINSEFSTGAVGLEDARGFVWQGGVHLLGTMVLGG